MPRRKLWASKKDMEGKRWANEQFDLALSHIMRSLSSLADANEPTRYYTDRMLGRMITLEDNTGSEITVRTLLKPTGGTNKRVSSQMRSRSPTA
jgi:hypothetical protein